MSTKIWIDANSKIWHFHEMTDQHVKNAIEWCKIRERTLERKQDEEKDQQKLMFIDNELRRIRDLHGDLEEECDTRTEKEKKDKEQDPTVAEVIFNAKKDILINGQLVKAGQTMRCMASIGDLKLVPYRSAQPVVELPNPNIVYVVQWGEENNYYSPSKAPQDLQPLEKADRWTTKTEADKVCTNKGIQYLHVIAIPKDQIPPAAETKEYVVRVSRLGNKWYLDGTWWTSGGFQTLPGSLVESSSQAKRFLTYEAAIQYARAWHSRLPSNLRNGYSSPYQSFVEEVPKQKYIIRVDGCYFLMRDAYYSLTLSKKEVRTFDTRAEAEAFLARWKASSESTRHHTAAIEVA